MEDFYHFFTIFQLLAALNFAQISKGFRTEFYKIIEHWDRELLKYNNLKTGITSLSQDLSTIGNDNISANVSQICGTYKKSCDTLSERLDSALNKFVHVNSDCNGEGRIQFNEYDIYVPCFLSSGLFITITMVFMSIANSYSGECVAVYFSVLSAFFVILWGILKVRCTLNKSNEEKKGQSCAIIKVTVIVIAILIVLHISLFLAIINSLVASMSFPVFNIVNFICCIVLLIIAILPYVFCAFDVFNESRKNHKTLNAELDQMELELNDYQIKTKELRQYFKLKEKFE